MTEPDIYAEEAGVIVLTESTMVGMWLWVTNGDISVIISVAQTLVLFDI